MKRIYKYDLEIEDEQVILMPKGSLSLCVQVQKGLPYLWALVDDEAEKEQVLITMVGTGNPADHVHNKLYLGTFQMSGGDLVWHVFLDFV